MQEEKDKKVSAVKQIVPSRLSEVRSGFSATQAAKMAGITPQVWNKYERGESLPGAEAIATICSTFHVSADWLLGLSESRTGGDASPSPAVSQAKLEGLKAAVRSLLDQY